jgi:hypothetical protein
MISHNSSSATVKADESALVASGETDRLETDITKTYTTTFQAAIIAMAM